MKQVGLIISKRSEKRKNRQSGKLSEEGDKKKN